jgi:kynureninase
MATFGQSQHIKKIFLMMRSEEEEAVVSLVPTPPTPYDLRAAQHQAQVLAIVAQAEVLFTSMLMAEMQTAATAVVSLKTRTYYSYKWRIDSAFVECMILH